MSLCVPADNVYVSLLQATNGVMPLCVPTGNVNAFHLQERLSPPGDRWCDVTCFVPASNVSTSLSLFQAVDGVMSFPLCPQVVYTRFLLQAMTAPLSSSCDRWCDDIADRF